MESTPPKAVDNHQQVLDSMKLESQTTTHGVDATVQSNESADALATELQASVGYENIVRAPRDDNMVMSPANNTRVKADTSYEAPISKRGQSLSEEERAFIWYHKDHASTNDILKMHQNRFTSSENSVTSGGVIYQINRMKKKPEDNDLAAAVVNFCWYKPESSEINSLVDCSAEQKAFLAYYVKASTNKLLKAFKAIFHQELKWSTMGLLIKGIELEPDFKNLASAAEGYDWYGAFDLTVKPRVVHATDGAIKHKSTNAGYKPTFTDEQRAYIGYFVGLESSVTKVTDSFYEQFGGEGIEDFDIKREFTTMRRNRKRRLHYLNIAESKKEWEWYRGPKQPGDPYFTMQERIRRQDEVSIPCFSPGICNANI